MNIGIFSDTYAPQVNGVVTVIRALKAGLQKRGHKVYVFTVKHPKAVEEDGVYRLASVKFLNEPQHRIGMFWGKPLFDMVRPLNLDIIHTHSEFSLYLASRMVCKKFKIPSVHTLHTYYPDYVGYLPPPLNYIMHKKLPNYLRHILKSQRCAIAPSQKNADYLSSIKYSKPVHIIPNGIDLSHFHTPTEGAPYTGDIRERFGISAEEDMIVFVGRLGPEKNIPVLLENFREVRKHRSAKLVIVGDGPDRHALKTYCHELGLNNSVIFTGYLLWPDEIKQVYAAANLFMSASRSEVHPITFIEAIASGLPVVAATDVSIESMVLSGENGWAVESEELLWEKALEILENKAVAKRMSERSVEISQNYTMESFVDSMLACYEANRK